MIKAVLFDMDGTLLDTERVYYACWRRAARETGLPGDIEEDLPRFSGMNFVGESAYFKGKYGDGYDYLGLKELQCGYVAQALEREGLVVKPGVFETLAALRACGILCAVVTSSPREKAVDFLTRTELLSRVDAVVTGERVMRGKPNPDIFLLAAEELGVSPSECVVVEDSQNGVRAGYAAGARVVLVPDMQPSTEELDRLLWQKIETMMPLAALINKENLGK